MVKFCVAACLIVGFSRHRHSLDNEKIHEGLAGFILTMRYMTVLISQTLIALYLGSTFGAGFKLRHHQARPYVSDDEQKAPLKNKM